MKPFAKSFCAPSLFTVLFALLMSPASVAQVAGQNVNMVSGTQWPKGDPFLQRQNEPSMAVSTRNPMHILAGSNDYRSVDLELVLSGGAETGDSWLGLFKSFDGGLTWHDATEGFASNNFSGCIAALSLDPANPSHLFASAQDGYGNWESFDGAATWVQTAAVIPSFAESSKSSAMTCLPPARRIL